MGVVSNSMAGENQYGSRSYWDTRYDDPSNQEAFEWLQDYKGLKDIIAQHLPNKNGRVLVVGTGRSNLAKDMNADGYAEVCGVDWCGKLIDKLNSRVDTPGLYPVWCELDSERIHVPESSQVSAARRWQGP